MCDLQWWISAQFFVPLWWKMNTLKTRFDCAFALPQCTALGWQIQIFVSVLCLFSKPSPFPCYLPSDGSDLDTVSHGSLDSANDSAERTSIDTDFTKMDSSDDGFSTGRTPQLCFFFNSTFFFQLISASQLLLFVPAFLWNRFDLNFMSFTSLEPHYVLTIILQSFLNVTVLHHQSHSGHLFFNPLNGICRIKCISQIPWNASHSWKSLSRKRSEYNTFK